MRHNSPIQTNAHRGTARRAAPHGEVLPPRSATRAARMLSLPDVTIPTYLVTLCDPAKPG